MEAGLLRRVARRNLVPVLRSQPDFLIIGTQKAGTTSLHRYLAAHPRISAGDRPKELHFFNLHYERGLDWYLSQFPWWFRKGAELHFEATPDYLRRAEVPARISIGPRCPQGSGAI